MAGCCCENKALTLYRGYPSEFADVDWLSITFESEPIDLTNFEAQFILGGVNREWTDITQGIIINLTDEETGSLPVGMNYGTLIVTDTSGNSKPFSTAIPVEVKTWVEGDQELDTYNMTVNALLDNEVQMVIRIETAKVSLDWVNEKIAEHNASEEAHPYIQGLIDEEKTARENADTALHNEIVDESTARGNADTGLHNEIVSEATTRYNADNLLHDEIVVEADIRERADIDLRNRISGKQDKLTSENAGVGISIDDVDGKVIISNTQTSAEWGNIQGTISSQTDLWNYLSEIGVLSNLTTTEKTNLVGAINEVDGIGGSALQPSDVVDNTTSTATDAPLSANMGKSLQDQIDNLKARGRFLALWNCATGLAQSNPPESPYTYQAGDYFIVGTISSADPAVNYKPNGSTYTTGIASVTVETNEVAVDDVYYYDGTNWRLQSNTQKTVSFVNIAGDPYDNTNLASALNEKQDELTAGSGIDITNNTISNTGVRGVSTGSTNGTISVNTNGTSAEVAVAGLGTAAYTSSTNYATSAQGTKADSAIQGVEVNGTGITPDSNHVVNIPPPAIFVDWS